MDPTLYIYDMNRKAEIKQSAQMGDSLLQEYIETLQLFAKDEDTAIMHSSYSPECAHITIDSTPVTVRKRVHFQSFPDLVPTISPIGAIPKLYLQRSLCTILKRSQYPQEHNGCIGLLGDNKICKHLAYMSNQTNNTIMPASLSQLIAISRTDTTIAMGLYERVRLAKHLATAVLYYHATPWLSKAWRSDDVHFFDDPNSWLQRPQDALPYISVSVRACSSTIQSGSLQSSEYDHFIRNPVLFGLGVMLLELAYQAPLSTLQEPVDLQKGETHGFADYFTAHRLVDHSYRMPSAPGGIPSYHHVILGLDSLEKIFQELQLNEPENDLV
ncbi:hypothetical protein FE257_010785 [Aspergillus nanangensis]|uniref:DUF7580 domain-containing protein n=1 Tax=Aspergillus nanangensis TaxID=2582783 RepID=A0AAD4GZA6_ASPNN|nr:hypothetical protein FE257_010785 [Aspergillus nanangensis]